MQRSAAAPGLEQHLEDMKAYASSSVGPWAHAECLSGQHAWSDGNLEGGARCRDGGPQTRQVGLLRKAGGAKRQSRIWEVHASLAAVDYNANSMALPRLKPSAEAVIVPKKPTRVSHKSNSRSTPATKQDTSGKIATTSTSQEADADLQQQLSREEEILSLLTALNAPVMNAELPTTLQAVKAHLYARNYAAAFGQPVSYYQLPSTLLLMGCQHN